MVATIIRMERRCRVHGEDVVYLASLHGEAELLRAAMEKEGWQAAQTEVSSEVLTIDDLPF